MFSLVKVSFYSTPLYTKIDSAPIRCRIGKYDCFEIEAMNLAMTIVGVNSLDMVLDASSIL